MRLESIYKQLKEGIEAIRGARTREEFIKGMNKLLELQAKIEIKLKKKEKENTGKKLQHLMGWYLKLWNNKPPEFLKFSNPKAIIGKHLKELIKIYEQNGEDIEALKKDYEHFLETWKKGNRGILHFRSVLPTIKQHNQDWVSPENKHDESKYKVINVDELFDDNDKLPF